MYIVIITTVCLPLVIVLDSFTINIINSVVA